MDKMIKEILLPKNDEVIVVLSLFIDVSKYCSFWKLN